MIRTSACFLVAFAFITAATTTAAAVDPFNTGLFGNVAVKGYDPVAYFTVGEPVKGSKNHQLEWNGANWRFASQENLEAFQAEPERYAPQYGGYCAWAVSQGYTAGIDPDVWNIVDDKLYLNYSRKTRSQWAEDIPGHIAAGDANWPTLVSEK